MFNTRAATTAEHLIDRMVVDVEHGRFECSVSALTAVAALVTTAGTTPVPTRAGR